MVFILRGSCLSFTLGNFSGLNHSLRHLDGMKLHEYNYTDVYLDAVLKGMHEVSFNGVSVSVEHIDIINIEHSSFLFLIERSSFLSLFRLCIFNVST